MARAGKDAKVWTFVLSPAMRGSLMFLAGLGLTIREALANGPERPSLYVLFAGMMGLPFIWGSRNKESGE